MEKLYAVVLTLLLLTAAIGKANYSNESGKKSYKRRFYFIIPLLFRFLYDHQGNNHQLCSSHFGERCQGKTQVMRSGFGTQNIFSATWYGAIQMCICILGWWGNTYLLSQLWLASFHNWRLRFLNSFPAGHIYGTLPASWDTGTA